MFPMDRSWLIDQAGLTQVNEYALNPVTGVLVKRYFQCAAFLLQII